MAISLYVDRGGFGPAVFGDIFDVPNGARGSGNAGRIQRWEQVVLLLESRTDDRTPAACRHLASPA